MSDWVVVSEGYGYSALELVKATAKQVVAIAHQGYRRERHIPSSQILATLPEVRAKAMLERLVSSAALETEDKAKAAQRHRDRVERIKAEFAS